VVLQALNSSQHAANDLETACSAVVQIFNLPADFQSAFREHGQCFERERPNSSAGRVGDPAARKIPAPPKHFCTN
jgi:hypothetical protein